MQNAVLLTSDGANERDTSQLTASIAPTANRVVLVCVVSISINTNEASAPASISGAGLTFTNVRNFTFADNQTHMSVWRALSASPSTGALTIAYASGGREIVIWSVVEVPNVDAGGTNGANAVVQSNVEDDVSGTATTQAVALSAFGSASNGAVAFHFWAGPTSGGAAAATPDTGWTELAEAVTTGFSAFYTLKLQTQYNTGNDTSAGVSWSIGGGLISMAVEIKDAGGGGGGSVIPVFAHHYRQQGIQ